MKGTCKQRACFPSPIHPVIALVLAVSDQASIELREPLNLRELDMGGTYSGLHKAKELTWKYWQKCSMKHSCDWVCHCVKQAVLELGAPQQHFLYMRVLALLIMKTAKYLLTLPFPLLIPLKHVCAYGLTFSIIGVFPCSEYLKISAKRIPLFLQTKLVKICCFAHFKKMRRCLKIMYVGSFVF